MSGSGKSTFCRKLLQQFPNAKIFSTDTKFIQWDWNYIFDPQKLTTYHRQNLEEATDAMKRKNEIVIIDNTNLLIANYIEYIKNWVQQYYKIVWIEFEPRDIEEHIKNNTHNVPKETLMQMIANYNNITEQKIFRAVCDEIYIVRSKKLQNDIEKIITSIV